ncbi:MAG: glycosyltransferase [Bacteroidales bacterium]|nr:glycosyltransferase [Bacteroidales bacterium]
MDNSLPKVSIITINYNGFDHTCEMIESLFIYETTPYELIVIDNGSRRNEAILLKERYPEIIVIRSEQNLGFAGGNNLGIKHAHGDYILLLNNDTLIRGPILKALVKGFTLFPNVGVVSPKILFEYSNGLIQYAGFTPMSRVTLRNHAIGYGKKDNPDYNHPSPTSFAHGAAMMISRKALENTGLMPECYFLYYEELDWCEQIKRKGYQIIYQPEAVVFHKESMATGSLTGLKNYYQIRNRMFYARRNLNFPLKQISLLYQAFIVFPKTFVLLCRSKSYNQLLSVMNGLKDGIFKHCAVLLAFICLCCSCDPFKIQGESQFPEDSDALKEYPSDIKGNFHIEISILKTKAPANFEVTLPRLKYNKKFAYSFTGDDTYASIYRKGFMSILNAPYLDLRKNESILNPFKPNQFLSYTDGCGNIIPFKLGVAVQIFHKYGLIIPSFSALKTFKSEYLTWNEINIFSDFGCGVYNHGGGFLADMFKMCAFSLSEGQHLMKRYSNVQPKVMIRPDGNNRYIEAALENPDFHIYTSEKSDDSTYPFINLQDSFLNLEHYIQYRTCLDGYNFDQMKARIDSLANASNENNAPWMHDFVHLIAKKPVQGVDEKDVNRYFKYINETYGSKGNDQIWFASVDEVYEYWYLREHTKITQKEHGDTLIIQLNGYIPDDFIHKTLTVQLKPIPPSTTKNIKNIEIDGAVTSNYCINDKDIILTLNLSNRIFVLAEKYLSIAEKIPTNYNLSNASYFVNTIPTMWQSKFKTRLDSLMHQNIFN